jgi:hypothetical protein
MGQKSQGVDRRWIVFLLASLMVAVGAAVLLYLPSPWRHHDPGVPDSEALEALKAVTAPTGGSSHTAIPRQPSSVPAEARLAEQRSVNGYTIKTWDTSAGSAWEYGRAMVEVIGPDGSVSTVDWVSRLDPVSGQDITGDGNPDVVIERYSGGASCCLSYVVLGLGEELTSTDLPLDSPAQAAFRDLDSDGILEVIGADGRFRCVLCCCANSPLPTVVLRYDRERGYIPASPDFPEIYDAVTPEYKAKAEGRWNGPFEEQDPTGRCYILPLVLAYLYSGRVAEAWEALAQYSPSTVDAEELRGEIERVLSGSRLFVTQQSGRYLLAVRDKTFSVQVDLNGDGMVETIVGVEAEDAEGFAESASPGDVHVFASAPEGTGSSEGSAGLFSCRSSLPEDLLPYFFQAVLAGTGDFDGDGLTEVALAWLGQHWWPSAYRPLAVLQFDPETRRYGMVIDIHRSVCEIGDYATADIDDDGRPEILEIDPIYDTVVDPTYGTEVYECHFCPHRYEIGVFEFTGNAFTADSRVNGGKPFVTSQKYEPYVEDMPVGSFLPGLITLARGLVQSPSATASRLQDRS